MDFDRLFCLCFLFFDASSTSMFQAHLSFWMFCTFIFALLCLHSVSNMWHFHVDQILITCMFFSAGNEMFLFFGIKLFSASRASGGWARLWVPVHKHWQWLTALSMLCLDLAHLPLTRLAGEVHVLNCSFLNLFWVRAPWQKKKLHLIPLNIVGFTRCQCETENRGMELVKQRDVCLWGSYRNIQLREWKFALFVLVLLVKIMC